MSSPRPLVRRVAALVVAGTISLIQAAVLVALGVIELISVAALGAGERGSAIGFAVLLLLLGTGLGTASVLVARSRAGARGPVIVAQLISLAVAWQLGSSGSVPHVVAWVVAVAAIVVLACLASGSARRAMAHDESARM